jgi:beta-lactamase class A
MTFDWRGVDRTAEASERAGGIVGLAIAWNGATAAERHGDRRFRAASTVKIPTMVELFRQVDAGRVRLDDRRSLRDDDRTPGSGVLQHLHTGIALTLDDLCTLMIAISDNTATNILLDVVGVDHVQATMRSLGMTTSVLGRRMLGRRPEEHEGENWATPHDYAAALARIVDGTAAAPASCERMLTMLARQDGTRRVTRYAPPGVRWGSKPGTLPGVTNDVGFVSSPHGSLVVSVFCEDLPSEEDAERAIAEIARGAMVATGLFLSPKT